MEQNKEVRSNVERVFACRWRSGSAAVAAPAAVGAALCVHSAVTDPGPESCHPSHHDSFYFKKYVFPVNTAAVVRIFSTVSFVPILSG